MAVYNRTDFHELLDRRLGEGDLRTIAFDLNEDFDNIASPHTNKSGRILSLIQTYEQRGALPALFTAIHRRRPDIPLPTLPSPAIPSAATQTTQIPTQQSTHYATVFISYSSKDETFAQKLYDDLKARGVRVWFAPEDLPIGAKTRDTVHEQIGQHDKLLLIISEQAIASDWVEDEVEKALERERREGRLVLFPIRIDDTVMSSTKGWAENLRAIRNIGNFKAWTEPTTYQRALSRLLRDLEANEQKGANNI